MGLRWRKISLMEIIAALFIFLIVGLMPLYQRLVRQRRAVVTAWADLEVVLRKRLSKFMELLDFFEQHEDIDKQMSSDLRALHHRCAFNPDPEARSQCERELGFAMAKLTQGEREAPPMPNQQRLSAIDARTMETQIADAAKRYNSASRKLNAQRRAFPNNVVALIFRIQAQPHFNYLSASSSAEDRQSAEAKAKESRAE